MGPTRLPETSLIFNQFTPWNSPEAPDSDVCRGEGLKFRKDEFASLYAIRAHRSCRGTAALSLKLGARWR